MPEAQHGLFEVEQATPPPVPVAPRRLVLDVSVRRSPPISPEVAGRAAFAAVVREADSDRRLAEQAEEVSADGVDDAVLATLAAYAGVIAGLDLARDADVTAEVEVRVPERTVVEELASGRTADDPTRALWAERARAAIPDGTVWTWVPRGDAPGADALADAALGGAPTARVVRPPQPR